MCFLSSFWWIRKVSIDGIRKVSIHGIRNYEMPQWFLEDEFELLEDDEDEDEDASENDENDEFDLLTDQETPLVVEQWL